MPAVSVTVHVPEGVDPRYVEMGCGQMLSEFARECERKLRYQREYDEALESDGSFAAFISKMSNTPYPPIVRANTYRTIGLQQELIHGWDLLDVRTAQDPRRPVVMRGALHMLEQKYTAKSRYAHSVIERYLRRIRFTSFDAARASDTIADLSLRICYAMPREPTHLWARVGCFFDGGGDSCRIWLAGKLIWVNQHQFGYLRKLHDMISKTKRLESKMAQVAGGL